MQCFSSTYNTASASAFYPSRPQKKIRKTIRIYTFENPQVRRSAFYQRPLQVAEHFQNTSYLLKSRIKRLRAGVDISHINFIQLAS